VTLPTRWVLATSNRGKLAELSALLADAGVTIAVTAQSELGVDAPAETGTTFIENALIKARHAAHATGLPAIADDSGLTVDALGGAPGVRSARFAGDDADDAANTAKLLRLLAAAKGARTARFHCALVALEHPDDAAPLIATGTWRGEIAIAARGTNGFGYDPVFFDATVNRTAAELDAGEKNRVSHRGKALRALVELLKNR
jgi:XTP/dITP diphosphohydrolase